MATDLDRAKSTSGGKYDAFVASRLANAEKRIRFLDLTAALLGFAALTLASVVVMVLCDSKLELSQHARKLSLYAFLAGGAVYLFFTVIRPLRLRVNPYYAARQVEQQVPGAKNSIVNWVDLHGQPLPPAIRGALGQRAAKDLSQVDLDRAISGRRAAWAGGLAALFAVAFLASFFLLGPSPFASLLKRAFNPFHQVGVSTRTQLVLVKPEGGNATVTVGRGVGFLVEVSGKVPDPKAPDAVKLLYRYEEGDPWLERRLTPEAGREWTTSLSALEIKNGLWYKITGGDAATEEYRIRVRAAPAVTDFLATYHYRPYVARADEVRHERELKALRGTEVSLRIRTNRTIRAGQLEFESKDGLKTVQGQLAGDDLQVFLVRFILDEDSKYRLRFHSADSEAYSDLNPYSVTAILDEKPTVELTKPGQDIRLPVNGLLRLEGKAGDDIGVQSVLLRMRVVGGGKLRDRPYRSDDKLRLADGGYPREVDYKDFIELPRVKGEDGQAFPLRPGMELEYWLEARDACDYPRPNPPGESKHFRVKLTEPEKNESKQQQEKKQAEQDKKQHEEQQEQKRQQENQERQQERQEQQARNKEEQGKSNQGGAGAGENKAEKKEGDKSDTPEGQGNKGAGDSKSGQGENNNESSKEDQQIEEKIKKALEKQEQSQNKPGEAKPDKGEQGESKGTPSDKPDGNQAGEKSTGEGKNAGQQSGKQTGESKDNPGGNTKSEAKGTGANKDDGKAEGKQGDSAPKGKPSDQGEAKPSPNEGKGDKAANAEGKADAGAQARNATAKDIEKLAKALESNDPRQREEAKRQLEQIAKQARDPQAREKAEETLEQTGQPDGAPDKKAPQPGDGSKNASASDSTESGDKKQGGDKKQESGDKKPGDSAAKNSEPKGEQGDKKQQGSSSNQGSSKEKGEPTGGSEGGDTPGGGTRREGADRKRGNGDTQSPLHKPSKPRDHRATQMQLEEFAKKVDKKILKDAGVSEEAWKKYLESRRKQVTPPEKHRHETPADPRQASQLPSMGGRTIQPSPSGQAGDVHGPDRGQPPPAYRDPVREFRRQMSKKN